MERNKLSRRDFLRLSAAAATGTIVAACAPATPVVVEKEVVKEVPVEKPVVVEKEVVKEVPVEKVVKQTVVVEKEVVKEVSAKPGKAKVVWWEQATADEYRELLEKEFVTSFNEAHEDIELEFLFQEELDNVLRTAIAAGAGPDIAYTPGPSFVLEYVNAGYILPLDEYSILYGWKDRLLPWAYETGMVKGKLYSLPLTYETMILYYNKTIFDQKGWELPTNREELETLCEAIVDAGMIPFSHSNAFWKGVNEWMVGMFYSNYAGADNVYKALTGQMRWDDPLFVEAVELIKDYVDRGWFSGSLEDYFALSWDDVWYAFCGGEAIMKMEGTWGFQAPPDYCEEGQEWDWTRLPILRKGVKPVYDLAIGSTLSINKASTQPDAAAVVLDWVYNNKERAARIVNGFNFAEWVVPLHYSRDDFPTGVDERFLRYIEDFARVTGEGKYGYTTWTQWPAKTDQYIIEELDRVLTGDITALEYCQEQQRIFEEEFREGKIPPVPGPPKVSSG